MKVNVLIDSYGWIEYFSEGPLSSKYAKYVENSNPVDFVTPVIVLYEVYKKLKSAKGESIALKAVSHIINNTAIIPISQKISLSAAEISIRDKLEMADALIKAIAEEKNATIVTSDGHFKNIENVKFVA